MQRFLIHFDVAENFVRLDTFISSAHAAQKTVDAINQELFSGKVQVELIVFAPEAGTLKEYIGITINTLGGVGVFMLGLTQFLDSKSIQEISKEVYGTHATDAIIQEIRDFRDRTDENVNPNIENDSSFFEESKEISERLIARSIQASLQVSRDALLRDNITENFAYQLGEAQATIFSAALNDPLVRGIGFSEEEDFPIPRHEFAERAVRPLPPKEPEEKDEWEVDIVHLRVTSPNFDRDDQVSRKWKAKHTGGGYYLFEILDETFWSKIRSRELDFTEGTDIEAQIATRVSGRGPRDRKVVRVLKVNNQNIAQPLDDNALSAALGSFTRTSERGDQPDLFSN